MKVIRCHHGQPAQFCQTCLTNNTPPPGWGVRLVPLLDVSTLQDTA